MAGLKPRLRGLQGGVSRPDPLATASDRLERTQHPPGVRAEFADEASALGEAVLGITPASKDLPLPASAPGSTSASLVPTYNQDAADEAAGALLWLTASGAAADEARATSPLLPKDILQRLERRGWLSPSAEPGAFTLTPEGRLRCQRLFHHLFGSPKSASLPPPHEPHIVEEEDGE